MTDLWNMTEKVDDDSPWKRDREGDDDRPWECYREGGRRQTMGMLQRTGLLQEQEDYAIEVMTYSKQ